MAMNRVSDRCVPAGGASKGKRQAETPGGDSSRSVVRRVVGVWLAGFGVMGHLMWFCLHLTLLLIPCQLVAVLLGVKSELRVFDNGVFDGRAAIAVALLLVYFPVACHWAARASGCFGSRRER